jgi:hypothetical protein
VESELQLRCSGCKSVINVSLITPASDQLHKKHLAIESKFGKNYSRIKVAKKDGENKEPTEINSGLRHSWSSRLVEKLNGKTNIFVSWHRYDKSSV